ncbi:multidrug resistance protein [Rhynchospora pubera]|uniref:Multidrug resistance protein n=1 Tax=Rhynchospora pubera TaxID=906938 RepID=A0AAV8CV70_9POAL|nr:multidrug resistance protein [Rhynchospora pubera]KAJ4758397.1 multidrug resistance protein [Rhynchospora pubera]KAJ4799233.1 multidrug resistance protein [Rhynchospora pubera]KAJ4810834.1 multidrug resistance protein [Rhynchospora pubera]
MDRFGDRTLSVDPITTPSENTINRDAPATWKDFGMSMNAISFGFAATAVLISMFLLMAIFEHFIKPRISNSFNIRGTNGDGASLDIEGSYGKVQTPSKVESQSPLNFSVVMPGQHFPTYIAQPAPLPREGIHWPSHEHFSHPSSQ